MGQSNLEGTIRKTGGDPAVDIKAQWQRHRSYRSIAYQTMI